MCNVVATSDCDHVSIAEEEAVCRANGVNLARLQCAAEDDLIRELRGGGIVRL